MCYQNTIEDVYTMHKQVGLVHYFSAYKKQPIEFQKISDAGIEIITIIFDIYTVLYRNVVRIVFPTVHAKRRYYFFV